MASPHSGRAAALHQLLQIVEGLLADIVLYLLHLLQFIRGAVDPAEKTVEQVMAAEELRPEPSGTQETKAASKPLTLSKPA